jgi:hypothetical protein
MRPVVAVGVLVLVVAGCGSGPRDTSPLVVEGGSAVAPYDGPMHVRLDHSDEATVAARSGAAGQALECAGDPYLGGGADYDSGLATVQDSAESALEDLFAEDSGGWVVPTTGYRVERRDDHRVLLSFDVGGRTKVAFVAADEIGDWKHHTGWGIEAWAQCDPAELPASVTDDFWMDVWTDASGSRVPVTTVMSFPGPEHCDWQDITFLRLGEDPRGVAPDRVEEYLRDTTGELGRFLDGKFSNHARLPDDAKDTGWRHDGRELWLVPDKSAAFLVSVGDRSDVERWPASTEPIGCA